MNYIPSMGVKDTPQRTVYLLRRNKQILIISLLLLLSRVFSAIGLIISNRIGQRPFIPYQWGMIGACVSWHSLQLILLKIFPRHLTQYHSILMPCGCYILVYAMQIKIAKTEQALMSNIISLTFFQMSAILTNACWPVAVMAILANMLLGIYQYVYIFQTYDALSLFQLVLASVMYCYACY